MTLVFVTCQSSDKVLIQDFGSNHDIRTFPTYAVCTPHEELPDHFRCKVSLHGQVIDYNPKRLRNRLRKSFAYLLSKLLDMPSMTKEYMYRLSWCFGAFPSGPIRIPDITLHGPELLKEPSFLNHTSGSLVNPLARISMRDTHSGFAGIWENRDAEVILPASLVNEPYLIGVLNQPEIFDIVERLDLYTKEEYFTFRVIPITSEGMSVISDMDDTLKDTNTPSKKWALSNIFYQKGSPVENAPEAYRSLSLKGSGKVAFHYLSGSPKAIIHPTNRFLQDNGFPAGSIDLTSLHLTWQGFRHGLIKKFTNPYSHKNATIQRILEDLPSRTYLFLGDDIKNDALIYNDIHKWIADRDFTKRAHINRPCIAIRIPSKFTLPEGKMSHRRTIPFQRTIRMLWDVPRTHLRFYRNPLALENLDVTSKGCGGIQDIDDDREMKAYVQEFWRLRKKLRVMRWWHWRQKWQEMRRKQKGEWKKEGNSEKEAGSKV
ncbi:MAG: hypothetical protein DHS80DRAFT_32646 [Piptocephalis tieghemiana]|nr:MAG: hypothetical protein DHS80DRAFT_32646 [Piptocephalis tieghemiana]